MFIHRKTLPFLIALSTFVLGFCVWTIYAFTHNAFFLSSPYDFPLLKTPTMFLGDGFVLPVLNYQIFKTLISCEGKNWFDFGKKKFKAFILVAFVLSLSLNLYIHNLWAHDQYTGVVDVRGTALSWVGWWHLLFSSLQMCLILLLAYLLFWSSRNDKGTYAASKTGWKYVIIFTSISFLDFFFRYFFVFGGGNIWNIALKDWHEFVTFAFTLIIFATASLLERGKLRFPQFF